MIEHNTKVKCQWCQIDNTAEEWNNTTLSECKSRGMRRAFKPIFDIKVFGKNSKHFFKCPSCGMWSRGNQLLPLDESGAKIKGLGGYPVMTVTDREY